MGTAEFQGDCLRCVYVCVCVQYVYMCVCNIRAYLYLCVCLCAHVCMVYLQYLRIYVHVCMHVCIVLLACRYDCVCVLVQVLCECCEVLCVGACVRHTTSDYYAYTALIIKQYCHYQICICTAKFMSSNKICLSMVHTLPYVPTYVDV